MTLPIFRLLLAAVALLAAAPGARAQTPEIRVGQRIGGMLATGDSIDRVGVGAYLVDELRFAGRSGQRVTVTLHSAAFDAYLRVGRRVDGRFVRLATDDDGAGQRGARVVLTLPEAGEYRIVVTSARPREAGAYTLALVAAGAPAGERGGPDARPHLFRLAVPGRRAPDAGATWTPGSPPRVRRSNIRRELWSESPGEGEWRAAVADLRARLG